jgi:hypothetical protein
LEGLQTIEKNEGVASILKPDSAKKDGEHVLTGSVLIKFQSKDKIPVYLQLENQKPQLIELEDELAKNEKVSVVYDILRYTKKNSALTEHGISFKPTAIFYYSDEVF